ncbi:hypothetical protein CRG98_012208 [Punica granatum]|uniref:Uncharacterized protein n=1 Tax=Punica granatum TaxID=22663 RepID=A0A2I0KFX7_PUNGR|nr:hypothetical protein CRG98_012208 [Punica granatum]
MQARGSRPPLQGNRRETPLAQLGPGKSLQLDPTSFPHAQHVKDDNNEHTQESPNFSKSRGSKPSLGEEVERSEQAEGLVGAWAGSGAYDLQGKVKERRREAIVVWAQLAIVVEVGKVTRKGGELGHPVLDRVETAPMRLQMMKIIPPIDSKGQKQGGM